MGVSSDMWALGCTHYNNRTALPKTRMRLELHISIRTRGRSPPAGKEHEWLPCRYGSGGLHFL